MWYKKNAALDLAVPMISRADPLLFKEAIALGGLSTFAYFKDAAGDAWTSFAPATAVAEINGKGALDVRLTAAETNHQSVLLIFKHADAATTALQLFFSLDFPQVPDVTVGPLVAVREPANRLGEPVPISMLQATAKTFEFVVLDAAGLPVDLSARVLRYVQNDAAGNFVFAVEDADIVVSGVNNEIASVPVTAVQSATASEPSPWVGALLDVTSPAQPQTLVRTRMTIVAFDHS